MSEDGVRIHIMDREYLVACPAEERKSLRQAAEYLDEQMRDTRERGRIMGVEKVAIMTALNVTHELLALKAHSVASSDQAQKKMEDLSKRIAKVLSSSVE